MKPLLSFFFLLFWFRSGKGSISLGSSLTVQQSQQSPWASSTSNPKFSFGLFQFEGKYHLGVRYEQDHGTLAWRAGWNVYVGSDGVVELGKDGNLVLYNSTKKDHKAWESKTSNMGVQYAEMKDTGNFVLQNSTTLAWQSFEHPAETLLPTQGLNMGTKLTSTTGTYGLSFESNGNISLYWNWNYFYWQSDTSDSLPLPTYAVMDGNGKIFMYPNSSSLVNPTKSWFSSDFGPNVDRRLTLDDDGNWRIYSFSSGWSVTWQALDNQCLVYGWCGSYGICNYNSTNAYCSCPSHFKPKDSKDLTKGCTPSFDLNSCGNAKVMPLDSTFLLGDGQIVVNNEQGCQSSCVTDNGCLASMVPNDGSGNCLQIRTRIVSGYHLPYLKSTTFLKICSNLPDASTEVGGNIGCSTSQRAKYAGIGVASAFVGLILIELLIWFICFQRHSLAARYAVLDYASGAPIRFTFKELQSATQNFSKKLGEGGFGVVYKGILVNKTVVAVKKLEGILQGEKEFRTEVAIIGNTHHMNLMHLVGFCAEGSYRLLVYEYMINGSLEKVLFESTEIAAILGWEMRFNIALGTAKGIAYLHEECRDCIIHCDLKPENILLDDQFVPKVSDFGLAKLINEQHTRNATTVRGTRGYLAPEWLSNLPITPKCDVFSYGMILLEIIGGRRNFDHTASSEKCKFPLWAFQQMQSGQIINVVDSKMEGDVDMVQLQRTLYVAFWCIQDAASLRPTMSRVVQMLEGTISVHEPPLPKSLESVMLPNLGAAAEGDELKEFDDQAC